ncbi:MAG: hypothetical protein LBK75_06405 [Oscillospiraceae bacterium]|jgi:hypothetical protein|nr:hypothetical protein [Oscillospiraceae bacterium]
MKRFFSSITCCTIFGIVFFAGCTVTDVSPQTSVSELPESTAETTGHYLDAYLPWQIETAKAQGIRDEMLQRNMEESLGNLEKFMTSLNAPLPPQSANDKILLDALLEEKFSSPLGLRSEMAVLLTEQRGEIYYSYVMSATVEYGGSYVVAWEWDGDNVRILDRKADNQPHSAVVQPAVEEIAGEHVIFGTLSNDVWYGDDRYPAHCGTFSVTMENGDIITQDVSNLSCVMAFLPKNEEYTYWSLTDTNEALIWDSLGSMWQGK